MQRLERMPGVPFQGRGEVISPRNSSDSVVFYVESGQVVKWNRGNLFGSAEECLSAARFVEKSIDLYHQVLRNNVLETQVLVGQKVDSGVAKYKVYEVQPYISGWSGVNLPEDLRSDTELVEKWSLLLYRLSILYIVSKEINSRVIQEGGLPFPINLTVGPTRKNALRTGIILDNPSIPKTPNLLINREKGIFIFDFGPYASLWDDRMTLAYEGILRQTKRKLAV